MLEDLVLARPVWSCNRQEAMTLAERLGAPIDDSKVTIGGGLDDFMHQLCDGLGATLRAPLVVRVGARGAGYASRAARRHTLKATPPRPFILDRPAAAIPV